MPNELPTLRGWGDELQGLPDLGKNLANLLSGGGYDLQQALKKAIAQDPSVAERLGDLSRDNPQLFGALRLGKLGDQIALQPKSTESQQKEANLAQTQAGTQETQARTTQLNNENDLSDVRKSIAHYQLVDLKDKSSQIEEQAHGYPGLKRGLGQVAEDVIAGKQPPELAYIAGQQGLAPLLQNMIQMKMQMRGQDNAMDRFYARQDKETTKKAIDEGTAFFKKYGVGSPQVWAEYLGNSAAQQTSEDLVANPQKAGNDPHLRALLAIGQRLKTDDDLHTHTQTTQNSLEIDKTLRAIKKGDLDRNTGLARVNDLFKQNAGLTNSRQIMIIPGDQVPGKSALGRLFSGYRNVAVDAVTHQDLGEINDISDANKFQAQPATQPYTQQDLERAKAALPNATPKDLSDLQKLHPEIYQILLPMIQQIEQQKKAQKGAK